MNYINEYHIKNSFAIENVQIQLKYYNTMYIVNAPIVISWVRT